MNRLLLSFFILILPVCQLLAQPISWLSDCSDKTFCFTSGDCTQGEVLIYETATTNCGNPNINYSYRIDLFNDGGYEILSSLDTVTGFFPAGTHRILWRASDNCGQVVQCTYLFHVKDCNPPSMICINGLTQTIDPPDCQITFGPDQFILSLSDNCTPNNLIERAIRVKDSGSGFPTEQEVSYGICDNGLNLVEIWVRDTTGQMNSCNAYVLVQTGAPECECNADSDLGFSGCARSSNNERLSNYTVKATVQTPAGVQPAFSKVKSVNTTDSCFSLVVSPVPFDNDYEAIISASRIDAALNGVTTFDLVMISKHILGIEPLTSAYQLEAADVNNSNSVTTFDIVEIRKLILGINDTFKDVPPWRFVRPLANPSDLGSYTGLIDTYKVQLPNLQVDTAFGGFNFVGIKYGDINFSAALRGEADERTIPAPLVFEADDQWLNAGDVVRVELAVRESLLLDWWQIALSANPESLQLMELNDLPESDYKLSAQALKAVSYEGTGKKLSAGDLVFTLLVKALKSGYLSEALWLDKDNFNAEAYVRNWDNHTWKQSIDLQIGGANSGSIRSVTVSPNPFKTQADFQIQVEKTVNTRLEIFTLDGRLVYSEHFELEAGAPVIRIGSSQLPEETVFVYRFWAGNQLFSGKLVKL